MDMYKAYVEMFEQAIEDRLLENCEMLIDRLGLTSEMVEDS